MPHTSSVSAVLPGARRLRQHFGPYLRRERAPIVGAFVALLAEVVLRLLEPWPLKFAFDTVALPPERRPLTGIPGLDQADPSVLIAAAAAALVVVAVLRGMAAYHTSISFALIGNRVLTAVRRDVYAHLQRLSLSFHARAGSGDLVVRIIGDIGLLKDVAVTALLPLLGSLFVLAGMLAVMFWLQWQLTVLALALTPLFWLSTLRLGRRMHEVSRAQRRREGSMASKAAESISGIKTVRALSLEPLFGALFDTQGTKSLKDGVKAKRLEAGLERSVDVIIAVASALVLWYGAMLVLRQTLTPGDLLVFLTYFRSAFRPVRDFAKYVGRLARATAAAERIVDLLERVPDVSDHPGAVQAPPFAGALRFESVSFEYEPGRTIIRGVDLDVRPGQFVALVGPSGEGKSTMAGLIPRLYEPTAGRVLIDGRDVRDFTLQSLRAQIAFVPQDTLLFVASVRDNIAYGGTDVSEDEIRRAATLANAHDFIVQLPNGYDTVVGERGVTLSNGQRQRIAIARAAVRSAPILVLDEPTTGLDRENEREVWAALMRLRQGRTTMLITHDLYLAQAAHQIFYLAGGSILARGTHSDLMRASGGYAAMYRLQAATREPDLKAHAVPS